jgi:two-component system, OmpR family, sensor histidine kinase KdpD
MPDRERGRLKIFLGYAAGVGKTYKMLEEAQALRAAGADVVVGYFEPHGRAATIAKCCDLELIPRRKVDYRGSVFEEMDTDAILARQPAVCVVDEFPHTNVPGSKRAKRWEDVEAMVDAGIDVLTTMNIQHLESLNDQVFEVSGIRVRETIPDWVVQQADEVVMVDLTPRALLHRLQRGVVYGREKTQQALQNFFRESTLAALRELALREAAREVGQRIEDGVPAEEPSAGVRQKILVLITPSPKAGMLIRRARRISDFLGAECFAVAVDPAGDLSGLPGADREAIERHLNFARGLRIETRILEGQDVGQTVVDFSRRNLVSQIFVTRPSKTGWGARLSRDPVSRIINLAKDMEVVIVSDRQLFQE